MQNFIKIIALFSVQIFFANNYFVSPAGNDNNNGLTISSSFLTIERASYAVSPGDTVYIRNGIYSKIAPESLIVFLTISGTANNPITFKNYPNETPVLQMNSTNWGAFGINGCDYIIIDGMTIIGNNDNITLEYAINQQLNTGNPATSGSGIAINTQYNQETNRPHHNIVRNCKISKCGGGGIFSYNADYTTIENNVISECGWYAPYGNSGISLYQSWNSDSNIGFKNFITGNTCFNNKNLIPFYVMGSITDGNGIIVDDGRNTQNNSNLGIYTGGTYVANNLVFDNGARAIHCYESDNVLIINNTTYKNCKSPSTQEGELTAFYASNIKFVNNIVSPSADIPPIYKDNQSTSNISAFNNLITGNENLSNPLGSNTIVGTVGFVNPSVNFMIADFHVVSNSLSINAGLVTNAPLTDKDGNIRLANSLVDIGCFEYQNVLNLNLYTINKLLIYPNPAKNYFTVAVTDNDQIDNSRVSIFDLQGRFVQQSILRNNFENVATNTLQKGIYIVEAEVNNKYYRSKIIIE